MNMFQCQPRRALLRDVDVCRPRVLEIEMNRNIKFGGANFYGSLPVAIRDGLGAKEVKSAKQQNKKHTHDFPP